MDFDDKSSTFHKIRDEIKNSKDVAYKEFLSGLKPDYSKAQRDLIFGYVMLFITMLALCILPLTNWPALILAVIIGSISVGYWLAYIQLFIHEAAHYNMAVKKENNEHIGNYAIGVLVGVQITDYRKIHFQHHRALGTTEDSENSYFFPVNLIMIGKMLFGIRVLEVLLNRKKITRAKTNDAPPISKILLLGLVLHLLIIGALALLQQWAALLSWLLGVAIIFPFFAALRQVLEHRSLKASSQTDYTKTDHGALTRIFDDGFFSRTFGAAGFNRHLIHHWEPSLSYTVYDEVLDYLNDTSLADIIARRKSTYLGVFIGLMKAP